MLFKIFLLLLLTVGCNDKEQSHLKSETYSVYGVPVSKSRSWYNDENGILYNVSEPVILAIKDLDYQKVPSDSTFIEMAYKSGFNTFKTPVDPKIALDLEEQNKLSDFVNNCAEEYGMNVILSIKDTSGPLRKLIKTTIHYPNIPGVDISTVSNIEDTAKSILSVNPEIMIFLGSKNTLIPLDIPKSKLRILD